MPDWSETISEGRAKVKKEKWRRALPVLSVAVTADLLLPGCDRTVFCRRTQVAQCLQ